MVASPEKKYSYRIPSITQSHSEVLTLRQVGLQDSLDSDILKAPIDVEMKDNSVLQTAETRLHTVLNAYATATYTEGPGPVKTCLDPMDQWATMDEQLHNIKSTVAEHAYGHLYNHSSIQHERFHTVETAVTKSDTTMNQCLRMVEANMATNGRRGGRTVFTPWVT